MFLLHKMYVCRRDFGFWFYSYLRVRKLIRGEAMNREIGVYERKKYPGQFLFGMGFLIGVILPNFIYRTQWRQSTASSMYLMGILAGDNSAEYFWQVLKMRGGIFLLAACSGVTIFGMPLAIMGMLAGGVLIGMLLTVSVLQFGLNVKKPVRCGPDPQARRRIRIHNSPRRAERLRGRPPRQSH